ncbi:MAG: NYN domain-containing protein [Deltaproteobacteria bacterium]|nr:NYN domain-containing protein [Deltaproteobacteria bacterium]
MLIFQDAANIEAAYRTFSTHWHGPRKPLDHRDLLNYLSESRYLVDAFCYLPIDPRRPMERSGVIEHYWESGWHVQEKMGKIAGDSYKCNVDVEMALDIIDLCRDIRPDTVVICSGDEDFLPLVSRLRRLGIRVEIASFSGSTARALCRQASGFVNLDIYAQEWLTHQTELEGFEANYDDPTGFNEDEG